MDLNNINEDWKKEAPILAAMEAANPFTVPDNYFSDSKEQISARLTIESLTGGMKDGAFTVPEGYFNNLNEQINLRLKLEELAGDPAENGFTLPEGYFETLGSNIESRIAIEELTASNGNAFTVPDNYFEDLQGRILARTSETKPGKTVKIRRLSGSWFQYAAAACITVMIGTGIFLNYSKKQDSDIASALSQVPDQEIVNYLEVNSTTGDAEVIAEHLLQTGTQPQLESGFSDQEIEQYLETSL
ncbi:hypothetical protein [Desertivirga brevis]|uniref:hypothetical protein n=1 Tax=Desertivirga brevis TaxID=2810310 RepID=UPI001A96891D|nr:hypothetical protein [Pedobacter sp. SYSU D00873]